MPDRNPEPAVPVSWGSVALAAGLPDTQGGTTGNQLVVHLNREGHQMLLTALMYLEENPDCPSVTAHVVTEIDTPAGRRPAPLALTFHRGLPTGH